ncbi:sensor histidine kinase [Phenylobacterium kunshanense]|nr:histidine kinase [Phenylobacterium kunshanense]
MIPPAARHLDSQTVRQALWLTLAVWTLDVFLYVLPSSLNGPVAASSWASVVLVATTGALLTPAVYVVTARTRASAALTRYLALAGISIVCGALTSLSDLTLGELLRRLFDPDGPMMDAAQRRFRGVTNLLGLSWMFALLGGLFMMLHANTAVRDRERQLADARAKAAEAEAAATAARLAALRYQLNPHFLFNTLNAVSSAVITGRNAEAESMLERLAEFLRVTLAADPAGLTPLEDEFATLQAYLEIESVRFRDRLGVEFACPPELRQALAPSFLLQPLVENAIKHGVSRTTRPVTVRLEAARDGDDLVVLVEDDAEGGGEPARGAGLGLRNVRQRLEVLYGERGVLQTTARERGFLVMIRMPLQWATAPGVAAAA